MKVEGEHGPNQKEKTQNSKNVFGLAMISVWLRLTGKNAGNIDQGTAVMTLRSLRQTHWRYMLMFEKHENKVC